MKNRIIFCLLFLSSLTLARAQGTAFTYQGQLIAGGAPANGYYDLVFSLFDAANAGDQFGATLTNFDTGVTNGLFTVELDFGPGQFTGSNLWLDISVRTNLGEGFTELHPRQPVTPAPYAIFAGNVATYTGAVADSQLSADVAKLNGNETFSGTVSFSSQSNSFDGTFAGNGTALTNVQAASLTSQVSSVIAWGDNQNFQTNIPAGLNSSNVVAVSGGYLHSIALKSDGTVVAWGYNGFGQTNVPVGLTGVIAVSGGYEHSLALKSDGTVVAWGDNAFGESSVPAELNNVVAISAGAGYSLALKNNGTLEAWGDFITAGIPAPFQSNLVAISASKSTSIGGYVVGLKNNGTVVTWNSGSPPAGLTNVVAIAAAGNNGDALALKNDGTIVFWGSLPPPPSTNNISAITAGYDFGVALKNDGSVMAWGDNSYNITSFPPALSNVVAVAAGGYHVLALYQGGSYAPVHLASLNQVNVFTGVNAFSNPADSFAGNGAGLTNLQSASIVNPVSSVVAWGYDNDLQTNVPAGLSGSNVLAVAGGYYHSMALKSDGTVVAWGWNQYGQTNVPAGLNGVIAINGGYNHSLALKADGTVVAWGDNTDGESTVPAGLGNVTAIAGGGGYSMALKNDGTVAVWGFYGTNNLSFNFQSNLVAISAFGNGTNNGGPCFGLKSNGTVVVTFGATSPPSGLTNVVAVAAAGNNGGLALKSDGTIVTWGNLASTPSTNNVVAIAAGYDFGMALKTDGTLMLWGDTTASLNTYPLSLNGVTAIAAGYQHALALCGAGSTPARLAQLNRVNAFTGVNSFANTNNTFAGSGAGLTLLNASNISSGTVADARLSSNVAFLNGNQTFSGANTLTNLSNVFVGAFAGNGGALTNLSTSALVGALTTNICVLVPGGGTNVLCFTNGILMGVH